MKPHLHLHSTEGRRWHRVGHAHAVGSAYTDADHYQGDALAAFLDCNPEEFGRRIEQLSGTFAAALESPGEVLLAADRIASIPLYFALAPSGPMASDDIRWLAQRTDARVDSPEAVAEMLLSGAPIGTSTLSSSMKRVRAGEVVRLAGQHTTSVRYFRYGAGEIIEADEEELVREGARLFEHAFERMLESVGGRPIAIPLSGGMDSRLIATLIARGGRTDAVAYTYGRPLCFEMRASRRMARELGLQWHFVRYSPARWRAWSASERYQRYRWETGGWNGIEHEQDWPAVQELMHRGHLPPDTVVVPGPSGGFLGGTPIPQLSLFESAPVEDLLFDRFFREWPREGLDTDLQHRLLQRIAHETTGLAGVDAFMTFGWQERHSKMIVHSVRVYEHFGLAWRLPYWADAAVLDFWSRVPVPLLRGRRLFNQVLERLMGPLYRLPSTLRPVSAPIGRIKRGMDADLRRYGIWLGRAPLASGMLVRVGDRARIDHPVIGPVIRQLASPIAGRPLQWVQINGLLALDQLGDLARQER